MSVHLIAPPDMPERQFKALQAIEERAAAYRASYAGQDYVKRRAAARKGRA